VPWSLSSLSVRRQRAVNFIISTVVHSSALGSCLLPNVTHPFFLFTLYIYLQEKHSSDVARRAILPSVRRYSVSRVNCRIRSCAILFRVAPPTPASHWTSASPLPQFHIQIRFPFTQQPGSSEETVRVIVREGSSREK